MLPSADATDLTRFTRQIASLHTQEHWLLEGGTENGENCTLRGVEIGGRGVAAPMGQLAAYDALTNSFFQH